MTATPNAAALQALLERVEAGESPRMPRFTACYPRDSNGRIIGNAWWSDREAEGAFYGNIKAAIDLFEMALPEWVWQIHSDGNVAICRPFPKADCFDATLYPTIGEYHPIPARALFVAILRALIATADTEGR